MLELRKNMFIQVHIQRQLNKSNKEIFNFKMS